MRRRDRSISRGCRPPEAVLPGTERTVKQIGATRDGQRKSAPDLQKAQYPYQPATV